MSPFTWIRNNKFTSLLLLVILIWVVLPKFKTFRNTSTGFGIPEQSDYYGGAVESMALKAADAGRSMTSLPPIYPGAEPAPQADVANRLVVQNSNLSLLVENVTVVRDEIVTHAQSVGGYMVDANVSNPQDAPTGTVTIRVPSAELTQTLSFLREKAIKVVSEYLQGTDVTDQYVDLDARRATLEKTKAKFEEILNSATEISDITNLNREILQVQEQIDYLKGQQESLFKNAELAKVTIYLSTDEIALPYAPSETFRPSVIFKLAVRSLVSHLRDLGALLIWAGVYAIVWIPLVIIAFFVYKRFLRS